MTTREDENINLSELTADRADEVKLFLDVNGDHLASLVGQNQSRDEVVGTITAAAATGIRQFGIMDRDALTGIISLKPTRNPKLAEVDYVVGAEFQGRGIATAAVHKLAELAFSTTDYEGLIAQVSEENKASRRVLEKSGFQSGQQAGKTLMYLLRK